MSRLMLLIAIAIVVYLLFKSYRKHPPAQEDQSAVEDMVRCAHCGVHLPKSESVLSGGNFFCGVEHRDAYRKRT